MAGQKRLKNAKVLCVGAGGLGSPALMYLAAAGVGTLGVIDFDVVDESNLQRQIIHGQSDIGRSKAAVGARTASREINPLVNVILHEERLDRDNVLEIFAEYDLIVDGTDNFATRYLVNDACVLLGKPYVWGSIYRFDGQASVFWAEHGPCYRCLYPEPPPPGMVPSCAEGGVLGVLCASIGSIQVTEAIKLLTGIGEPLLGRLMIYDALEMTYRTVKVRKDPECAICGKNPTVTELIDYEAFCGAVSEEAQQAAAGSTISVTELEDMLDSGDEHLPGRRPRAGEYEIVSIPGATLIPKDQFLSGAALADCRRTSRSSCTARAASAAPRCWPCSRTPASPTPCTSAAASSPGSTRSTRPCRSTDPSRGIIPGGEPAASQAVTFGCGHPAGRPGRHQPGAARKWLCARRSPSSLADHGCAVARPGRADRLRGRRGGPDAAPPVQRRAGGAAQHLGDAPPVAGLAGRPDLPPDTRL